MSDPRSPEGMKPETPESDGPETPASGGEQSASVAGGTGAESSAPKAQAYVDPEIAAEAQLLAWEAEKADLWKMYRRIQRGQISLAAGMGLRRRRND